MRNYEGIAAAADDVRRFFYINEAALPGHVADSLRPFVGTGSSPVDLTVRFARVVYANREDSAISDEAKEIASGCALLAGVNGFHGLGGDDRDGERMAGVLAGARKTGPAPDAEFLPPEASETPAEPET